MRPIQNANETINSEMKKFDFEPAGSDAMKVNRALE